MSEPSFNFFLWLSCVCRRLFFHIKIFSRGATVRTVGLRGAPAIARLSPVGSDYSLFGSFCTFFIFAFYFHRRCEWSVALGITDMTRDTLLLEFSQVRATPIEEPRVPLCLPSRAKRRGNGKPRALSHFFCCCCCPFNF